MKIAFINASPKKVRQSASGTLLKMLEAYLGNAEVVSFQWNNNSVPTEELERLADCDAAVIAFPLYVDCLPSHMLRCMIQLEKFLNGRAKTLSRVGVIINNGFFEPHQNIPAMAVMRNWCARASIGFIGGLGVGGGGMIMQTAANGPFKVIGDKLKEFSEKIADESYCGGDFDLTRPSFPPFLYKQAAQMGWRMEAKKNGLRVKDLWRK